MSRNLKILVPVVLALGVSLSGTALAASQTAADAYDQALYGQPDPYIAVQPPADNSGWAAATDPRIHKELQRASTAHSSAVDWRNVNPTAQGNAGYDTDQEPE